MYSVNAARFVSSDLTSHSSSNREWLRRVTAYWKSRLACVSLYTDSALFVDMQSSVVHSHCFQPTISNIANSRYRASISEETCRAFGEWYDAFKLQKQDSSMSLMYSNTFSKWWMSVLFKLHFFCSVRVTFQLINIDY